MEEKLYIIPAYDILVFPETKTRILVPIEIGYNLKKLIEKGKNRVLYLVIKEKIDKTNFDNIKKEDFYDVGIVLDILNFQETNNGFILDVETKNRVKIKSIYVVEKSIYANYEAKDEIKDLNEKDESDAVDYIRNIIMEINKNVEGASELIKTINKTKRINELISHVIPFVLMATKEKQQLLECDSLKEKSIKFAEFLIKQKQNVVFKIEMAKRISDRNSKAYRKAMLREELKAIKEELNEDESDEIYDKNEFENKIEKAEMPDKIKEVAIRELKKLSSLPRVSMESGIIKNYLETLVELPWTSKKVVTDINEARECLDRNHYSMDGVKERILQHLAVMKLKNEKQGSILLLVGAPGTGKTSLGKSIADALKREYVRVSLGGIRDEAEIRGHRRTYVGALPGKIIQGMKKVSHKNPVFVLDEVDKIASSYMGDPASALLEVLDPEQNNTFSDHYLEVPYDLSEVLFVATANSLTIPAPLLDRMEVIEISSYTDNEKFHIAKKHIVPLVKEEHGMDDSMLIIEDGVIEAIINDYTREAGVRGLKKQLSKIARVVSEKIVSGKIKMPYLVNKNMLLDILGRKNIKNENIHKNIVPGVVKGLAWTPVGGEVLYVEASIMPGNGKLTLTGQLGNIMKESAEIALSLVRSRLIHVINNFDFSKTDIHIHVPSGATPKDGPSAGITLFTVLASLLTGKKVDSKLAMTGEITLSGSVLPIGGVKEKVLAAHREGIEYVVLPQENENDLKDVPDEIASKLDFIFVRDVEEVLKYALGINLPNPKLVFLNESELKLLESNSN